MYHVAHKPQGYLRTDDGQCHNFNSVALVKDSAKKPQLRKTPYLTCAAVKFLSRQSDTQTNYHNPHCTCMPMVNDYNII